MKHIFTLWACCTLILASGQTFNSYWDAPDSNHFTVIGQVFNQMSSPIDLAFHPDQVNRPFELWVLNQGTESSGGHTVLIRNADGPNFTHQMIKDGNAWHFMALATSLDFGDNGNWATAQGIKDANRAGGTFTGPTLWSSDLGIYGVVGNPPTSQYNGSHLDMIHQSPYGKGIAHERDNVYWVLDGWSSTLSRYDFKDDHGPGQSYHGDGEVHVYNEIYIQSDPNLPSHLVLDKSTNWLYVCNTPAGKIIRVDVTSGTRNASMSPVTWGETLADYASMKDVVYETVVSTGLQKPVGIALNEDGILVVTDNATGEIVFFDTQDPNFAELGRLSVDYPNPDLMGVTVGPDNKIYFVDYSNRKVFRIDNSMIYPAGIEQPESVAFSIAPNPTSGGHSTIHLTKAMNRAKVVVRAITGQVVQELPILNQDRVSLDLGDKSNGMYLVELRDESGAMLGSHKLLVQD